MTIRWVTGKEPTKDDVKSAISNAMITMLRPAELDAIATAVIRLYKDRIENRR